MSPLGGVSAAHLLTRDDARRIAANIGPSCRSCCASHRPLSTHFRYDLNSGHFAALRSVTSWAITGSELPYSITSSAVVSNDVGISRPIALAAFKLRTSSYLVGACTGSSLGLAPLRMRSA
jgi:hypothetical protein